ncbi:ABC transporter ATP-binding protein [Mycoplasma buteonis]|uniref:ABC transporter ATP-binding protein n=1 Tax=Mycoplasma buteonis TaxID=171280 RepID=UPI0005608532|nr:ABC transporter ATP-binding protein [Mycoplasma buteonis]
MRLLVKKLSKKVKNQNILSNLDLEWEIDKGLFFITGPSGIGKTTFLNLISGLDKEYEGEIVWENNLRKETPQDLIKQNKIGFVFQDFNLFNDLSAYNNISVSHNILGKSFEKDRFKREKEYFKLGDEISDRKAKNLSGGEKQRLAILRALSHENTEILICDEPTGNLDSDNKKLIFDLLKEISKEKIVFVISHDQEAALKYHDYLFNFETKELKISENLDRNTTQEKATKALEQDKSKFIHKLKPVLKFVLSDFKKKIWQFFLTIFLLGFSSSLVANAYNIYTANAIKNQQNALEANIDNIHIDSSYLFDNQVDSNFLITDSRINQIQSILKDKEVDLVPQYQEVLSVLVINPTLRKIEINPRFELINDNEFWKSRLKKYKIEGNANLNENQIILGQDLAEKLRISLENPTDLWITANPHADISKVTKFKVVGINRTNILGQKESLSFILTNDWLKIIQEKENKLRPNDDGSYSIEAEWNFRPFNGENAIKNSNSENLSYEAKNDYKDLQVSLNQVSFEKRNLSLDKNYLFSIKTSVDDFEMVAKVTIDNFLADDVIGISSQLWNSLNSATFVKGFKLYLKDYEKIPEYEELLKTKLPDLKVNSYAESVTALLLLNQAGTIYTINILTIAIGIISLLFVIIFAKTLTDSKKKEIGLLKVLGTKLSWNLIYHYMTFFTISLISLLVGLALYYPVFLVFSNFIDNLDIISNSLLLNLTNVVWIWFVILIISSFIYLLVSIKNYNKNTAKLLRN